MKKVFLLTLLVLFGTFEVKAAFKKNEKRILSEQVLKDKVKGAWAGQTLGCSYGGPTEQIPGNYYSGLYSHSLE